MDKQNANRERHGRNVPARDEGIEEIHGTGAPQPGADGADAADSSNLIPGDKGPMPPRPQDQDDKRSWSRRHGRSAARAAAAPA